MKPNLARYREALDAFVASGAADTAKGRPLLALLDEMSGTFEAATTAYGTTPVTAGAPRGSSGGSMPERMARVTGRAQPSPDAGRRPLTASAVKVRCEVNSTKLRNGDLIESGDQLAQVMAETLSDRLRPTGEKGERRALVAMATWELPEERRLRDGDVDGNTKKLDSVCGLTAGRYDRSGALVATGGICLPVGVDYSVPTWSTADRPLRDGLPAFQASRGGIQFVSPPDIGTSSLETGGPTGAGTATTVWTQAIDASPGANVKPVWTVQCGAVVTSYCDALATRVKFGNMQSRFAPEQVAANTQQAIAAAARTSELNLLARMYSASKQVIPKQYLGATRDILASADLLSRMYRYTHRIPDTATMTAVFPAWARSVIRADMAREIGHDNTNQRDVLAISDAEIDDWFKVRGINPIWTYEGLQAGTYGTGGTAIPTQQFVIPTAGAQPQWPGQTADGNIVLAWLLYVEGTFQFLDGGRLDLGVVRDSILDATNDYECHSADTEILTESGWKAFRDLVRDEDFVATRNPKTHELEWQLPFSYTVKPWKNRVFHFETPDGGDMVVSPRHRMLVVDESGVECFVHAEDVRAGTHRIVGVRGLHESWKATVESYAGDLFCCSVGNETLLTRRPGHRPVWAGNTFVEPFEGIAFRGLEVYQVQSTVLPNGGSAGSLPTTGYHE